MSRARQGDPRPAPEIILHRDVAVGEVFTYIAARADDRVRIVGDIAAGAQVAITAAEVEWLGNVADGARITYTCGLPASLKTAFLRATPRDGLIIDGTVGHKVTLRAETGIRLRHAAGDDLDVEAAGDVRLARVGDRARIKAGREAVALSLGADATVTAGTTASVTLMGPGSRIRARGILGAKGYTLGKAPACIRDMRVSPATTYLCTAMGVVRLKR